MSGETLTSEFSATLAIGESIAVTNKIDFTGCSGIYQGVENGRMVVKSHKGNIRTFSVTSGLWFVRTGY